MSSRKSTFLVTGASKGIGRAVSANLAAKGHIVVGIARTSGAEEFPGTFFSCDLGNLQQTEDSLDRIAARFDIDGIVNNVGISLPQPLGKIDFQTFQSVMDLNVRAAVQVTQKLVEGMKVKKWGRIVNVCSRAIFGARDRTAYAAAKSALVGCTRTWALELAEFGITSNAVAPGPVETELFRQSRPVGSEAEHRLLSTIPMRRVGQPDEVAAAICFFLSSEASFITGEVLAIDGGGSLGGR
jgi:3-oxoacyl-[acyl-carrier protein] reductase